MAWGDGRRCGRALDCRRVLDAILLQQIIPQTDGGLVFSGSLREGSLNTRLAQLAAGTIEANGGSVDFGSMAEFGCPSYNADVQANRGFPDGPEELRRRLEGSDAFVISSLESNASLSGPLKNAVDWVSRFHPQPFHERHALLLSASPSMVGGNRGAWALRVPFDHLGNAFIPTCSRSPRRISPSTTTDRSETGSCGADSTRRSPASWTSSRRPSTTRASRPPGWSSVNHRVSAHRLSVREVV